MRRVNQLKGFLGLFLLVGMTSCSMFSYQNTGAMREVPSVEGSVCKALSLNTVSVGDWPEEKWWEVFACEELNQLIEKAMINNPTLQRVSERVEAARQVAVQKRAKLFPWLFATASDEWIYLSENGLFHQLNTSLPLHANLLNVGLGMNYEVDIWRKYRNFYEAAVGETKAREAENKQIELMITTAIAEAYFSLRTNLMRKELLEQFLLLRQRTYNLQNLLQQKGLSSNLPLYERGERLEEAKQYIYSVDGEIAISQHMVNVLIGEAPDSFVSKERYLPSPPKSLAIPETLPIDLVARRPDLIAAIWRVSALGNLVGAANAEFFPNINLKGFLGFQSLSFDNLFDWSSKTGSLFPAIHLPIFNAGSIQAGVNRRKAEYQEAIFAYNDALLKATQEVANSLTNLNTFSQKKESQEVVVGFAFMKSSLTDLRFSKGLANALSRYEEQERLIWQKLQDLTLLYGEYFSMVQLTKSLGGGYSGEIARDVTLPKKGANCDRQ